MVTSVKPASLDEKELTRVRKLEKELNKVVVVYEPQVHLAALSPAQVAKLNELEQEWNLVLLAYELQA